MSKNAMRAVGLAAAVLVVVLGACEREQPAASLTDKHKTQISDSLSRLIVNAYDLTRPGEAVGRLMSLYPDSGRVVSASAGAVITSRDTLEAGIRAFWDNVGRNMRNPKWIWGPMQVDVLSPDAAVVTATYKVEHLTPRGEPHVIAGAWTAVFQRRSGRWVIVQEHLSDVAAGR